MPRINKPKKPYTKRIFARLIAKKLANSPPKSEQWFYKLYEPFRHTKDEFNRAYKGYIPDVINFKYRYIIEIDGSIHKLPSVMGKDRFKQNYYERTGFKVFRIKAYDITSFDQVINAIRLLRK